MHGTKQGGYRAMAFVVLLAMSFAASAAAQPAATDEQRDAARQHFERGVSLAEASQWADALVEFDASVAAMPTAPGLLNLGLCQRNLGHNLDAELTFERFMSDFGSTADPADVHDVQTQLGELHGLLGRVVVRVDADGAAVTVGGRAVGTAPLSGPIAVDPGDVTVEAQLEGRDPAQQVVAVAAGQDVEVALALPEPTVATVPPEDDGTESSAGVDPAWLWTTVGIAGAAAVAWGVTGGLALAKNSTYQSDSHRTSAQQDEGRTLALGADISGAITGAAAVAAVVLIFFTDWGTETPDESGTGVTAVSAAPLEGGMALGVVGRF